MFNFDFHNPTKIYFGRGKISKLASFLPEGQKILMVYGKGSIKKNGVYDQVKGALKEFSVIDFSGIQPNPRYEKAMEAIEICRSEKIDFILAVGGGSVIDSAKFIASGVNFSGDPWDICQGEEHLIKNPLPFGAILTLPATGSEMNMYSVISRGDVKTGFGHPGVFPKFSILDPQVTLSLDARQIGNGIVDAFIHTLEVYLTYPVNAALQDRFAESVLKTLIEEGGLSFKNPQDYDSRANYMWSASMALSSVFSGGVPQDWTTHMIGHELTALYDIDHARTLALVWPKNMRHRKENKKDKMLQYAQRVWGLSGDPEKTFDLAVQKTEEFFKSVGVPTDLSAYSLNAKDVNEQIYLRFKGQGFKVAGEKEDLSLEMMREFF
jgi:NADP-dependent alcohol dehydrogenase